MMMTTNNNNDNLVFKMHCQTVLSRQTQNNFAKKKN